MNSTASQLVWSEDTRYAYAVGRVRALEAALLKASDYERLLGARDFAQTFRILSGAGYDRYFATGSAEQTDSAASVHPPGEPQWEKGLRLAEAENRELFDSFCLDQWLRDLVELPSRLSLLKASFRREPLTDREAFIERLWSGLFATSGRKDHPAGRQKNSPAEGKTELIPQLLADTAERLAGLYPSSKDEPEAIRLVNPARLDMILERLLFDLALELTRHRHFAHELFRLREQAVQTLARARTAAVRKEDTGLLEEILPQRNRKPQDARPPAQDSMNDQAALFELERDLRVAEIQFLHYARYTPFGYEPIIAYYYLREHELRNLRTLLASHSVPGEFGPRPTLVAYA